MTAAGDAAPSGQTLRGTPPRPAGQATGRPRWRSRPRWLVLGLFALPAVALMGLFLLYPTIESFQFSLYDWNGVSAGRWIGLDNYRELFSDEFFRAVLRHSLTLALLGTFGAMAVGLLWAYGIERRLPGWRAYRFLLFIPVVMPITVSALLWALLLDAYGPLSKVLSIVGISQPPDLLGDPQRALLVVIGVSIWQASGFTMLIILGAMEDVPSELHDAASIDGASSMRRLFSIVVPQIRGTLATLTVVQFVGLLKAFDLIFALTQGGPGNATDVMGTYLLQKAFNEGRYGYGSAVAATITVLVMVLSFVLYRRLLGKEVAR